MKPQNITLALLATAALLCGCTQDDEVKRKHLRIVGQAEAMPPARIIAQEMLRVIPDADPPRFQVTGNDQGFARFCQGIGPRQEDIVLATRKMRAAEYAICASHNVRDVIEVPVGHLAPDQAGSDQPVYLYVKALHNYGVPYLYAYLLGWRENWAPGGLLDKAGLKPLGEAEQTAAFAAIEDRDPLDPRSLR